MKRLRDVVGQQQPDDLLIGDLRELTAAYETSVAALFRSVVHENMALRQQLMTVGLDPPTMASDLVNCASALPPRPVAPVSLDFRSEADFPDFSCMAFSKCDDSASEIMIGKLPSERSSECASRLEEPEGERKGRTITIDRFMPKPESFAVEDSGRRASVKPAPKGLARVVQSLFFESFMSGCIILNCVTEGLWAHNLSTQSLSSDVLLAVEVVEHIFVAVYTIEFALKIKTLGWRAFKPVDAAGRSNFADSMLLLFTGILPAWLVPTLALIFNFDGNAGPLKTLSVLRTARLARLVRVFQRVAFLRDAVLLFRGLSDSSRTLFWTCIVILLVTYIFAIVGLATIVVDLEAQLAWRSDPEDIRVLSDSVTLMSGLDQMMLCLVQVLVSDSYHAFLRPVLKYVWWSGIFWYSYVAIAVFVLMNLVTAVIVENAMANSRENQDYMASEKEAERQRDLCKMHKLFQDMDVDGGGSLSWQEFSQTFEDPDLGKIWKVLDVDQRSAWELFQLLDDGDGEITVDEFIEALRQMSGVAQAKDMFRLQKLVVKVIATLDTVSANGLFKMQGRSSGRAIELPSLKPPAL